ncbi:helix-turn-helix domain-containing protein [Methylomonas sp. TEB]
MTPTQVQVAALIRQGLPTKMIASTLDIAPGTISVHRKQIRKKLGLESKSDNLQIYLKSLSD